MNGSNGLGQSGIFDLVAILWPSPPRKIATNPDTERLAQPLNAVLMTMLLNESIDQWSLAKKASAFFKISRS
jgi:hypothetical protein